MNATIVPDANPATVVKNVLIAAVVAIALAALNV
jgi:hypothetical protein